MAIEDVLALLKKNFTLGVLFEKWVGPDDRNSKNHIVQVRQSTNRFGTPFMNTPQ